MRKLLSSLVVATALAAVAATPASAITNGQYDGTKHPNVAALIGTFDGQTSVLCTGTLISPTIVLTAAHCDVGDSFDGVSFSPDPIATGARPLTGSFIPSPAYSQKQDDPQDLAVIVLDKAVKGIAPARLPSRGLLDQMKASGQLTQSTQFTVVGYGAQEVTNAPGGHPLVYEDRREYTVAAFNSLGPGYLRLTQNPTQTEGGACYGDSGGPDFLGAGRTETDIIAGTTITGDVWCKSTNVTQRLDTDASRAFLGRYVRLP